MADTCAHNRVISPVVWSGSRLPGEEDEIIEEERESILDAPVHSSFFQFPPTPTSQACHSRGSRSVKATVHIYPGKNKLLKTLQSLFQKQKYVLLEYDTGLAATSNISFFYFSNVGLKLRRQVSNHISLRSGVYFTYSQCVRSRIKSTLM